MFNELQEEIYENAIKHGFYDTPTTFPERIALVHSELSEALEDFRAGHDPDEGWLDIDGKPHGIPYELADVVIRVLDMAALYNVDLDTAVRVKMDYNKTRPYRHGGKRL